MTELQYIGKPARRVDAFDKLTGKAKYIADYKLPSMLYARCLRSEVPHARIVKLDTAPALAIPGVRAVITSDDYFEQGLYGFPVKDKYMLAYQKVRYVGEAIAAVAADTPQAALAGIQAIICELEPLPAVFDPDHALDPDAPQIGPDRPDGKHPNFLDLLIVRKDNPLAELEKCPVVIDQRYTVGPQEHAYIEPEGVLAVPTPRGRRDRLCAESEPLRQPRQPGDGSRPAAQPRARDPAAGGRLLRRQRRHHLRVVGAGGEAGVAGRPAVRMIFSREESMIASYKRDAMRMRIRLGADRDGTLRACKFEGVLDSGAYASRRPSPPGGPASTPWAHTNIARCDVDVGVRLHQQRLFRRVPWLRQH